MPSINDLRNILGVSASANPMEIRQAYMDMAAKYHPDKNPEGGEKFIEASTAYHILSDPDRLETYIGEDSSLYRAASTNLRDQMSKALAEEIHSRVEASRIKESIREADLGINVRMMITVKLDELYMGTEKQIQYRRMLVCRCCQGTRVVQCEAKCSSCNGQGKVVKRNRKRRNRRNVACGRCRGSGKVQTLKQCTVCHGLRYIESKETATVIVPKGGPPHGQICLTNKGHEKCGVRRQMSHLMVGLQLIAHPNFKLCGESNADLVTRVPITLTEALLGFDRVLLTHLDGRKIKVSNPVGKPIDPFAKKCIRSEGMPLPNDASRKGDLVLVFEVKFPRKLTISSSQKKQLAVILTQDGGSVTSASLERLPGTGGSASSSSYLPTAASSSVNDDSSCVHERTMVDNTGDDTACDEGGLCAHCNTKPLFDETEMWDDTTRNEAMFYENLFDMFGIFDQFEDESDIDNDSYTY